jgi:diguanylate cyclase (GGDEF)-like protein
MSRPTPADRTRLLLRRAADALEDLPSRVVVLGGGIVANLGLHLLLADPNIAWASAPLVLLAGLVGGVRIAVAIALAVGLGHTVIDVTLGVGAPGLLGYVLRIAVLMGVALVGSAGALIEAQRTRAVRRAISEDPTTGLLSVRAFYDELEELRGQGVGFTILLVDIRGMRRLNETYGHPTGTEAMRALAHVLRRAAGPAALASRLGSDEVAVALVGEDRERCHRLADDVVTRLHEEQVSLPDGARFEIHVAYGVARYPEDGDDVVRVLRAADQAKERAKADSRAEAGSAGEPPRDATG